MLTRSEIHSSWEARKDRGATLIDQTVPAGQREVMWDGRDDSARSVPSGPYVVRLVTAAGVKAGRVMLVR